MKRHQQTIDPPARRRAGNVVAAVPPWRDRRRFAWFWFGIFLGMTWVGGRAQDAAPVQAPIQAPNWVAGYRIRYPLKIVGDPATFTNTVQSVLARLPTGGWLRPDGGDVCVQLQSGQLTHTAVVSHHVSGDTIIQFKRNGNDLLYWAYAVSPNAPAASPTPAPEGIVAEYRQWAGDLLDNWGAVAGGLKKSETVIGNAIVGQVIQKQNPARPDNPRNFAASYRGFLQITNAGVHRFFVNADDAAFLFMDGFKVFEQTGSHLHLVNQKLATNLWGQIELAAGVHPFEVHHVCGNNPQAQGYAGLWWRTPNAKNAAFVPREAVAPVMLAEAAGVEEAGGWPAATFAFGMDDTLNSEGVTLYLARFEAQGNIKDPAKLLWDFGDGGKGTGRSVSHIYFTPGEYKVSLKSLDNLPAFTRTVYVWTAPIPTSPFSLSSATRILSATNWSAFDIQKINVIFDYLLLCEQPDRWPLVEKLARHLLAQPGVDPKRRAILHASLMEAIASQGRGAEAVKLMDQAVIEFIKLPSLQVEVMLTAADIYRVQLKEFKEASRLYEKLINEHRTIGVSTIRQAAIHWGDLFTEAGDMVQAGERYRLAHELGGEKFQSTGSMEAIQRGALLRVAEQKLRSGEIRETRRLLERIELEFPEQKLEGLYRFLRAETDRYAGRYEDAIRNYEVLIKLSQWSSFRDRAFFGIADSYYRMEDFQKCLEWLDALKESFPAYYDREKLKDYRRVIQGRIARIEAAREAAKEENKGKNAQGDAADIGFKGFETGFEPGENQNPGRAEKFRFEPMMGMMGPHVGFMQSYPAAQDFNYFKRLRNMMANGNYWVEFWYRDEMCGTSPTVNIALLGSGNTSNPDGGTVAFRLERTFGQWRKAAAKMKAPITQDGLLRISFTYINGSLLMDGVRILPISDRENDSLRSFIQGDETP